MYLTLVCTAAIVLTLYLHFRQVYMYFSRHGVKQSTPIPLVGNLTKIILKMEHLGEAFERDYRNFPEERFVGQYVLKIRQLVIRDLELIKKITVKDFDHFRDRLVNIDSTYDPAIGKSMFFLKGQEWKDMRSTFNPAFTGSKIRQMVPFMMATGEQMVKILRKKSQETKLGYIDVDVKDLTTRFSTDVIVSFTFGLELNSYTEVENYIYTTLKAGVTIKISSFLISLGLIMVPKLIKAVKLFKFPHPLGDVCRHLVRSTAQDREERNIVAGRADVIHLLMEAEKRRLENEDTTMKNVDATVEKSNNAGQKVIKREWSDDLIAQAVIFVIANFETVSATASFLLHELALNPGVQEKLYQEIMENETRNGGKFDYTSLLQLKYMDMVVSEILRLWPPPTVLSRVCIKDYNCGKPNDKSKEDFILRKCDGVVIPVWAIHRDPQYFPDPLKFDPERFSDENKHKIKPLSYMPFGFGPRTCIGSRLAVSEVKVMAYQLVKEMELSPAAKTRINPELSADSLFLQLKGGHWVRMTPRTKLVQH